MSQQKRDENLDQGVIDSFGHEWAIFDYTDNESSEALNAQFSLYCSPIELSQFNPEKSVAGDFGAGSGRWASRLLPYFSCVYALEPSDGGSKVLRNKFKCEPRLKVLQETVGINSIPNESLDLAMSLGVLHHIPDTAQAIKEIASKVKFGGTFLCYLYYRLDDKPISYRVFFWFSNSLRWVISRLPYMARRFIANIIAITIYLPLSRVAKRVESKGREIKNIPLHHYANMPFVILRNDALDRFGTRLEQRFSKGEISEMLERAGFDLKTLKFSSHEPFWTFAIKK